MHIHTYTHTYIQWQKYIYVNIYTHTHVYVYIFYFITFVCVCVYFLKRSHWIKLTGKLFGSGKPHLSSTFRLLLYLGDGYNAGDKVAIYL